MLHGVARFGWSWRNCRRSRCWLPLHGLIRRWVPGVGTLRYAAVALTQRAHHELNQGKQDENDEQQGKFD
jgi:hypothetical protein